MTAVNSRPRAETGSRAHEVKMAFSRFTTKTPKLVYPSRQ
jgi:hypothetical protein